MRTRRTLVTGGAGFIGSAIARRLIDEGWDVRVLDNFRSGLESSVPPGADVVAGDVCDVDTVRRACRGVDVVFHQAAVKSVPRSLNEPLLAHASNATGTLHVLVAAEEAGARRIVYASSSSVYGGARDTVQREDMTPHPVSPYAASKLAGESYCRVWTHSKGLPTVSLRYFNVFGPGQHADAAYAAVFPAFISALAQGRPPEVHWDGEQSRDFTYVDDVVEANLLAARAGDEADGAVINIAGGRPRTVNHALESISAAMGRWIEPVRVARRAGDVRSSHADIGRARDLIAWAPRTPWEQAVNATVDWFTRAETPLFAAGVGGPA